MKNSRANYFGVYWPQGQTRNCPATNCPVTNYLATNYFVATHLVDNYSDTTVLSLSTPQVKPPIGRICPCNYGSPPDRISSPDQAQSRVMAPPTSFEVLSGTGF